MTKHELNHLFIDDLRLCACGRPQTAVILVRDVLRLAPFYEHRDEMEKLLVSDGIEHIILGQLDAAKLIEHGGGIGGSWLTDKGTEVLAALEEFAPNEDAADSIFPDTMEMEIPLDCKSCYPPESEAQ